MPFFMFVINTPYERQPGQARLWSVELFVNNSIGFKMWRELEQKQKRKYEEEELQLSMLDNVMMLAHHRGEKERKKEALEARRARRKAPDTRSEFRRRLDEKKEHEENMVQWTKKHALQKRILDAEEKYYTDIVNTQWEMYWKREKEAAERKKLCLTKESKAVEAKKSQRFTENGNDDGNPSVEVDIAGARMVEVDRKAWVLPRRGE